MRSTANTVLIGALAVVAEHCVLQKDWPAALDGSIDGAQPGPDATDGSTDAFTLDARDGPALDVPADVPPCRTLVEVGAAGSAASTGCLVSPSCPDPSDPTCNVRFLAASPMFYYVDPDEVNGGHIPMAVAQVSVQVSAFAFDTNEVTVARFRRFEAAWQATNIPHNPTVVTYPNGGTRTIDIDPSLPPDTTTNPGCNWTDAPSMRESHPINCVPRSMALAFCEWDGGRLPTEVEFEYVSHYLGSGMAGSTYVWAVEQTIPPPSFVTPLGDGGVICPWVQASLGLPDGGFQPCDRHFLSTVFVPVGAVTAPSGSFLAWQGFYDLAGNVAEWSADNFAQQNGTGCWANHDGGVVTDPLCTEVVDPSTSPMLATLRGGEYSDTVPSGYYYYKREPTPAASTTPNLGFRCAYPLPH